MEMKKTKKGTKQFTKKEKLQILGEAKKNGLKITLEKYDLYSATYYSTSRREPGRGKGRVNLQGIRITRHENYGRC